LRKCVALPPPPPPRQRIFPPTANRIGRRNPAPRPCRSLSYGIPGHPGCGGVAARIRCRGYCHPAERRLGRTIGLRGQANGWVVLTGADAAGSNRPRWPCGPVTPWWKVMAQPLGPFGLAPRPPSNRATRPHGQGVLGGPPARQLLEQAGAGGCPFGSGRTDPGASLFRGRPANRPSSRPCALRRCQCPSSERPKAGGLGPFFRVKWFQPPCHSRFLPSLFSRRIASLHDCTPPCRPALHCIALQCTAMHCSATMQRCNDATMQRCVPEPGTVAPVIRVTVPPMPADVGPGGIRKGQHHFRAASAFASSSWCSCRASSRSRGTNVGRWRCSWRWSPSSSRASCRVRQPSISLSMKTQRRWFLVLFPQNPHVSLFFSLRLSRGLQPKPGGSTGWTTADVADSTRRAGVSSV
jgi:hypothetical protein